MLASIFEGVKKIALREIPIPEIKRDELLVQVKAATICGTDLRIYSGEKTKGVRIPSILGHELAGEIAAVGSKVKGWLTGMRVTVAPVIACGVCYYCSSGLEKPMPKSDSSRV